MGDLRVRGGAAAVRWRAGFGERAGSPPAAPWALELTDTGGCPEIDCLRRRLTADTLAAAAERAASLGTGADRVLIAAGALDEEAYLRVLGGSLDIPFDTLDGVARALCPIDDARLIESAAAGLRYQY